MHPFQSAAYPPFFKNDILPNSPNSLYLFHLCATVGFGDITSANIVGYISNGLPSEEAMTIDVGVSLSNVCSVDGSFVVTNMLCSTKINDGDVILIFNAAAYNYDWYQYFSDYEGKPMWGIQDMETYEWTYVESFTINNGDSIVFMPADTSITSKITVAGQVADLAGASRVFAINFDGSPDETMFPISNPYPVATTAGMLADFIADGDVLLVWNDAAYNYDWYQYFADMDGKPTWGVQDMETYEWSYLESSDDVILEAGHGAVFMPSSDGVRTWTVSLQ